MDHLADLDGRLVLELEELGDVFGEAGKLRHAHPRKLDRLLGGRRILDAEVEELATGRRTSAGCSMAFSASPGCSAATLWPGWKLTMPIALPLALKTGEPMAASPAVDQHLRRFAAKRGGDVPPP